MIDLNKLITDAVREKNPLKANVFRMVKSKVEKELQSAKRKSREATKDDVVNAIKKEYKEIREEIAANWKVDPPCSATLKALSAKLSYLDNLLPKVAPIEEAIELIKEHMRETHDISMGSIMRIIKSTGKNFDMKEVSKKVKEMLK